MIITRLSGGMGNQMFQYALGRALSLKNNVSLKTDVTFLSNQTAIPIVRKGFVQRQYSLDVFNIESEIAQPSDIPWYGRPFLRGIVMQVIDAILRKIPILPGWEKKYAFDEGVLLLGPNAYLAGFWQSYKYFESIADTIRKDFTLKDPLPAHIQQLQVEVQSQHSVCLHVRRGDYAGNAFQEVVFKEYYYQALDVLEAQTTIEHIYVFSDDIAWCKDNFAFLHSVTFVDDTYAGQRDSGHFALMQSCTHFIIPNSTFSWWAAWLGAAPTKVVVAPKQWFGDVSIDTTDLVPASWVRI